MPDKRTKPLPTIDQLRDALDYNPETGALTWKWRCGVHLRANNMYAGKVAGHRNATGYISIRVHDILMPAHRAAWAIQHGSWPDGEIDHVNRERADNRICNLRVATRSENSRNVPRHNDSSSPYKGVSWDKAKGLWQAGIGHEGKRKALGRFKTAEEARDAYQNAARQLYGEFASLD